MKPGDKIKVTADSVVEGIFVNETSKTIFVKLDNGYNVGISKDKIKKKETVGEGKKLEIKHGREFKPKKGLPEISILHTGGTIASKVDYRTGAVFTSFKPEDLVGMFPELSDVANINSKLISNMWSEDMNFGHYKLMAKAIAEEIKKGCSGVILTHGTDTLGYTAAALAFVLENVPVPVIIVGAQRSSDRGSSDSAMNMISAANFILNSKFAGVAVCMHSSSGDTVCDIMPACKTRKMHSSRRDAFKVINDKPIASIDINTKEIKFHKEIHKPQGDFKVMDKFEEKVGLLKVYPGIRPEQFKAYKNYKGLVIEGTGLGHAPINHIDDLTKFNKDNLKAIKELASSGCVIVMTSQTLNGRVNMNVYSTGVDLQGAGVIPGEDMLAETAFIKLAWLLGNYPKEAKEMVGKDLRGEINKRISADEFC
ncbi:MAG: Glu-tRNA(Gln) amidotransferase subunit GatD [Nanoarchaeota archaeon]|nr:Glu-tRNA(Gln) amidotransferase subunit GatD [Nanoarchaeota archaeon]MBU1703801.1 Glu-tRNA(Gln) amidotransferase subunit GatD [Nanoarchaeota archaeon]